MGASLFDQGEIEGLLVVAAALEAGLIDVLAEAGTHTAASVAASVEGDLRATGIMLEALVALGVAERVVRGDGGSSAGSRSSAGPSLGATFTLTDEGRRHLVDPGPDLERNSMLHQVTKVRGWLELPYVVKHGHPPDDLTRPRSLRSFVRTMAEGDPELMEEVVGRCLDYAAAARPVRTMLDAGGAVGHMAARFAARGVQATLCDRPAVLDEAREFLGDESARVRMSACDFTSELPPGPYDLVYLGNVLHIYGPETNKYVCRLVFDELNPGGSIAIRDFVWERSPRSALFAVNMLQATSEGGVWREAQFREWLVGAGFVDIDVVDLERSRNQLILARRPRSG